MATFYNLLLRGVVFIVAVLLVLFTGCGQKKPGIYINGQRIPLEKISYDASNLTMTIPTGYPSVKSRELIEVAVVKGEMLREELLQLSGSVPDPAVADSWVHPVDTPFSFYGDEAADQMEFEIVKTLSQQKIRWEGPITMTALSSVQYQVKFDLYDSKQYLWDFSKSSPKGDGYDFTYVFPEGLPAGAYAFRASYFLPLIIVR